MSEIKDKFLKDLEKQLNYAVKSDELSFDDAHRVLHSLTYEEQVKWLQFREMRAQLAIEREKEIPDVILEKQIEDAKDILLEMEEQGDPYD